MKDDDIERIIKAIEPKVDRFTLLSYLLRTTSGVGRFGKVFFRGQVLHEITFNNGKIVSWFAEDGELKPEKVRESLELKK